jgi:hypothetical protein
MFNPNPGKPYSAKQLLVAVAGLTLLLLLLFTAGRYPDFIESYYSTGLYYCISPIWHFLLGWVPFSIGDIFYSGIILLIIGFVYTLISRLLHKRYRQAGTSLLKFLIGLQLFIAAFYLLWGMNYFRPPASKILSLQDSSYTFGQLQTVTRLLIDSTNINRALLSPLEQRQSNKVIYVNAVLAVKQLSHRHVAFQSFSPAVKPSMFTHVINYMGTAGYFNPFSGEAQINYAMPVVNRPITACHEMAHQMGFAREDEANFVGFLAGERSPDRLLRYSAYYMAMQEFMAQVYRRDTVVYHQLKANIAQPVKNDMNADRLYWEHYQNQLGYFSSIFYDRFLKMNNQPEGLRTYNRMINLTITHYRKAGKIEK